MGGSYACLIRTPNGGISKTVIRNINAPLLLWSLDTSDWKIRDADYVYNQILSRAKNGSIVLMHDIYESSVKAALRAADALKKQGYEFVTVCELMRRTGVHLKNGKVYTKAGYAAVSSAYKAPTTVVSKEQNTEFLQITCSAPAGLAIYYTTNGSYPRLSDHRYDEAVLLKPGTVFTAIGIDKWGTGTPPVILTAGAPLL